jgi:energy-coupling factor transporter ATP-binding protein EcfA2
LSLAYRRSLFVIVLSDVTQHYGVRPVLSNISLKIASGRLTAIVGPNGMGKTTLLGVIAGILSPQRWAYGAVHHRHDRHSLRVFDSWSLGLLLGWFVSALLSAAPNAPPEFCYLFIVITSMACTFMRLYRYRVGHASPISFLGRLFTGRWIIPGYDRVFLAPLAALFTVAGLPPLLWSLRLPNPSIA